MALVRCILGKFLGVICHCFPRPLEVPTFAAKCLHVCNDARDPSSERWNYGRERLPGNSAYIASLFTPLGIFYMPQMYDMGPMALLPLRRKACWGFFRSGQYIAKNLKFVSTINYWVRLPDGAYAVRMPRLQYNILNSHPAVGYPVACSDYYYKIYWTKKKEVWIYNNEYKWTLKSHLNMSEDKVTF